MLTPFYFSLFRFFIFLQLYVAEYDGTVHQRMVFLRFNELGLLEALSDLDHRSKHTLGMIR